MRATSVNEQPRGQQDYEKAEGSKRSPVPKGVGCVRFTTTSPMGFIV